MGAASPGSGYERRVAERFEREDLNVTLLDGVEPYAQEPLIKDISLRGLGLQVSGRVDVGQTLRMRLDLPSGRLDAEGSVRWVDPSSQGCRCGVRFSRLGMMGSYRLRRLLEPESLDWVQFADFLLKAAVVLVVLSAAAKLFGFELGGFGDLRVFLNDVGFWP